MAPAKPIFGAATLTTDRGYDDREKLESIFSTLQNHGVITIDSAQAYGDSETILGRAKATERFVVDTKLRGGLGPEDTMRGENITKAVEASVEKIGGGVDVLYIHAPAPAVPVAEQTAAINAAHKAGHFKRFGLSNFSADQVREVHDHCKTNNYVLPTVYQGNYNPVACKLETLLLPTLRELGMSLYAYSPIAGGFLTKTSAEIKEGKGRFDTSTFVGQLYSALYSRASYLEALAEWETIAKDEGVSRAELAYRWIANHSVLKGEKGDGIIVGASSNQQLQMTLEGLEKGPLSQKAAERVEGVWKKIEHEAPGDNSEEILKMQK